MIVKTKRSSFVPFLFLALLASTTVAQDEAIHALLVGVTTYPALSNAQQLRGPINDVIEVETTLLAKFGTCLLYTSDAADE